MRRLAALPLLIAALAVWACEPPPPPSLDEIQARAVGVEEPEFDSSRRGEPGYMEIYRAAQRGALRQKAAILLDAVRYHATDPRLPELLNQRWELLVRASDPRDGTGAFLADIEAVLAAVDQPDAVRHGAYWRALARAQTASDDGDAVLAAVLDFADAHPEDRRGATLLQQITDHPAASPANVRTAWQRIAEAYPRTYWAPYAPGQVRRIDEAEQPVTFRFTTFRDGEEVSSETLAGKVVVLDFWATTCAPCITALPEMRRVYAEYRDQGVEFVGVSLDESEERGGRERLVGFLEEHEVPWPIYYQGHGYSGELSFSWGVGAIPEVFLLDRDGRLVTTEARGRLAELIPELL